MSAATKLLKKMHMAAASDVGTVRKENEDSFYYSRAKKFFIVCDGMGGHKSGAVASKLACETLRDLLLESDLSREASNNRLDPGKACSDLNLKHLPELATTLLAGVRLSNRRILAHALSEKRSRGMGTTVVAATFFKGHILFVHVGDSRLYRLRQGELRCLTSDHSWLNELIEDKEISEKDAESFKKKNVLTRALGIAATVKVDLQIDKYEEDDLYLVCTDGLHNALSDDLLLSILSAHHGSLQGKVNNLVDRAKMLDGADNITAGLIYVPTGDEDTIETVQEKQTMGDEPEEISDYLDETVKQLYPMKSSTSNQGSKKFGIYGVVSMLVAFGALFLFHTGTAQKGKLTDTQTGLFSQNVSQEASIREATSGSRKKAGYVVLVQVGEIKHLHALSEAPGYRVLDAVSEVANGTPIAAGTYTWAMADSRQNILYKRQDIQLRASDQLHLSDKQFSREQENAGSTSGDRIESSDQNQALIFLIGDFETPEYADASVVIDDTLFGPLEDFKNNGIRLSGGFYTIKIVAANHTLLRQKSNIEINNGETIAVEF